MNKSKYILLYLLIFAGCIIQAQQLDYVVSPDNPYWRISTFSEGLARVELDSETFGFINTSGNLVFKGNFYNVGHFYSGRAWVKKEIRGELKYGFINTKGKLVIPCIYDEVEDFSENRTLVNQDGIWSVINKSGKTLIDDSVIITEIHNGNGGYDIEPPAFHNGLMLTRRDNKFGYVNASGKIVISCQYAIALDFSDGVAMVAKEKKETAKQEVGEGKSVIDSLYNSLPGEDPQEYVYEIIDKKGKVIKVLDGRIKPDMSDNFSDGMFPVYDGRKKGFINKHGKIIVQPQYDGSGTFNYSDGVVITQIRGERSDNKDGYMRLIDTKGKTVSEIPFCNDQGCMYDSKGAYHEGLLAIKIKGFWGYMDKQGKMVIPAQFRTAQNFYEGCAVVGTKDGKVAVIKNPLK